MIEAIPQPIIHRPERLNLSLGEDVSNQEIGKRLNQTLLRGVLPFVRWGSY